MLSDGKGDVNARTENGTTALMLALSSGHCETAQALMEAKADITVGKHGSDRVDGRIAKWLPGDRAGASRGQS